MLQLTESPCMTGLCGGCHQLCRQIGKVFQDFYLGTLLMSEAKRRNYLGHLCWCRRDDELVDGPGAAITTRKPSTDEAQLESLLRVAI